MSHRIGAAIGLLAGAGLLCAAGCERDRPGARTPTQEAAASRPISPLSLVTPSTSPRLDAWFPDTEAFFGIDLVQFRESPLGGLIDSWLRTAVAGCGDGIVEQARHVLVVTRSPSGDEPLYVLGGVSRGKTERCQTHAFAWLDDQTLVIGPGSDPAELESIASGRQRTNPRLLAAVSNVDTRAALWVAAAAPHGAKGWTEDLDELRGTIAVKDGLRASFHLKYHSIDKAASAAVAFEKAVADVPPFSTYLENARATADGPWLQTTVIMSREQLARIQTDPMFSGLFPSPPKD